MVVINRCVPHVLNAYSTSPLTLDMTRTVQHGFYDGASARFDNPPVVVNVHDRPEFHGLSHYDIRIALDNEGEKDVFILVDERTFELDAV